MGPAVRAERAAGRRSAASARASASGSWSVQCAVRARVGTNMTGCHARVRGQHRGRVGVRVVGGDEHGARWQRGAVVVERHDLVQAAPGAGRPAAAARSCRANCRGGTSSRSWPGFNSPARPVIEQHAVARRQVRRHSPAVAADAHAAPERRVRAGPSQPGPARGTADRAGGQQRAPHATPERRRAVKRAELQLGQQRRVRSPQRDGRSSTRPHSSTRTPRAQAAQAHRGRSRLRAAAAARRSPLAAPRRRGARPRRRRGRSGGHSSRDGGGSNGPTSGRRPPNSAGLPEVNAPGTLTGWTTTRTHAP